MKGFIGSVLLVAGSTLTFRFFSLHARYPLVLAVALAIVGLNMWIDAKVEEAIAARASTSNYPSFREEG